LIIFTGRSITPGLKNLTKDKKVYLPIYRAILHVEDILHILLSEYITKVLKFNGVL